MTRSHENRCFRRFQETRDPRLLAKVFDATAAELLRVAGHLAGGDKDLTQDALQATFLTAIEQAHKYDAERDVRPWLLGILANHVRKERRRSLRHRSEQLDDPASASKDSPVLLAEGSEFGAATKHAMQQLPPPFREALVLHLQHGLTANEIAEALGRPAGTVRTQIVRGMDRLRALLPAGFTAAALGMLLTPGPILAAVRNRVLAGLPTVAVGSSSFALTGWRLYAMIAAGVTVLVSVLIPWLSSLAPLPPVAAESGVRLGAAVAVEDLSVTRDLVAAAPREVLAPVQPKPKVQRPANLQRVALKVVYQSDGKPAANVPVGVELGGHLQTWHTDERGRLELYLPWPGLYEAYVLGTHARTMFSWHDFVTRPRVVKKRIEIAPGMQLAVRVVDSAGQPVADALVESTHGFQVGGTMLTEIGRTDANGWVRRRDIPVSGQMRAWAAGYLPGRLVRAQAKLGGASEVELTLSGPALKARGVVVDENGKPIANARLALVQLTRRPQQPQFLTAAADGTFELQTLHEGAHALVGVHMGSQLRRGQLRFSHSGGDAMQIELRLTRGASIKGRLTNADGQPLAMTNIVARFRPEAIHGLPFLRGFTRTAADGTYVLDALVPGVYELETDKVASKMVTVLEGETQQWDPVQTALQPITMRLLDALGNPLVGWYVSIIPPGREYSGGGTITGEDGRRLNEFSGWVYAPGSYCRFSVHKKLGKSDEAWNDHARLPSLITPPLLVGMEHEIRVPLSALSLHVITGTILDHEGTPVPSAKVDLVGALGQVYRTRIGVDETGAFRFEDLPPGRYHASVSAPGRPRYALRPLDVRDREGFSYGVVKLPRTGRVVVAVPAAAGADGLKMQLVSEGGAPIWLRRQEDGTWRSRALFYGDYTLRGWTAATWVAPQPVSLRRSEQRVEVVLVPHEASRVVVELGHDYGRNSSSWNATLTASHRGRVVFEHKMSRAFLGTFQDRMEFLVPLPPGNLDLRVKAWNKHEGEGRITVPAAGGGQVTVRIE